MNEIDTLRAALGVIAVFDALGIEYHVGGSIASSFYGVSRSTMDADLIANILPRHVLPLVQKLESTYYVEGEAIREAITLKSAFNLIHLDSMLKVDVFVLPDAPYDREAFARAVPDRLLDEEPHSLVRVASAEDVVLNKLRWYRLTGDRSERQWSDVLGVLKVQAKSLDVEYMRKWAGELTVTELLERALMDAGLATEQ